MPASYDPDNPEEARIFEGERRLMEENRVNREAELLALDDLQADQIRFDTEGLNARRTSTVEELELVEASSPASKSSRRQAPSKRPSSTRSSATSPACAARWARSWPPRPQRDAPEPKSTSNATASCPPLAPTPSRTAHPGTQITDLKQQLATFRGKKERSILAPRRRHRQTNSRLDHRRGHPTRKNARRQRPGSHRPRHRVPHRNHRHRRHPARPESTTALPNLQPAPHPRNRRHRRKPSPPPPSQTRTPV